MAEDVRAFTIAERLRVCAMDRLADTAEGEPDRSCVIAGALAWECECGGELTVALTSNYPSSNFPTPSANTAATFKSRCGEPIVVYNLSVTMLRCVPLGGNDAEPPACADLAAYALTTVEDASAVQSGIICCLTEMVREKDANGTPVITAFSVGNQDFVGPAGLCGGSSMAVQIGLLAFCPCPD